MRKIMLFLLALGLLFAPPGLLAEDGDGYYDPTFHKAFKVTGQGVEVKGERSFSVGGTNPAAFDVDGDGTAEYILGDTVPSAANDTGTAGTLVFDATGGYIYFCTATDTWIRVQMTTW